MNVVVALLHRLGLCKQESTGHHLIGLASVLGVLHIVAHVATVIVTCTLVGFDWGMSAWMLDLTGWLAACGFAVLAARSSNQQPIEFKKNNFWILLWSSITLGIRILDTLMLFGVVVISSIYITPHGAVLYSNIVSEILLGVPFTMAAFIGSIILLLDARKGEAMAKNEFSTHQLDDKA